MKIEMWPLERIKPYPNNPRRNDGAVDAVVASIRAFGFRQPLVVDGDGVLIVGHTRLKAAQCLGPEWELADGDEIELWPVVLRVRIAPSAGPDDKSSGGPRSPHP